MLGALREFCVNAPVSSEPDVPPDPAVTRWFRHITLLAASRATDAFGSAEGDMNRDWLPQKANKAAPRTPQNSPPHNNSCVRLRRRRSQRRQARLQRWRRPSRDSANHGLRQTSSRSSEKTICFAGRRERGTMQRELDNQRLAKKHKPRLWQSAS
jgi:hypothetical protein